LLRKKLPILGAGVMQATRKKLTTTLLAAEETQETHTWCLGSGWPFQKLSRLIIRTHAQTGGYLALWNYSNYLRCG